MIGAKRLRQRFNIFVSFHEKSILKLKKKLKEKKKVFGGHSRVDSKCPVSNASRQEITYIKFKAAIRVFSLSKNASTNPAGTSGRFSSHICLTHLAVSDTFFFSFFLKERSNC